MNAKLIPDQTIIYSFDYPVYQLKAIGSNVLLAAGGGGLSKTGVPNRIDAIHISRPVYVPKTGGSLLDSLIPTLTKCIGGTNTNKDAIMHMTLTSQSSGAASILAIEGSTCQEYFLHANDLEPSQVADVSEQDFQITSSGNRNCHNLSSSSNSSTDGSNGISTTVKRQSKCADGATNRLQHQQQMTKTAEPDSSGTDQLPWCFQTLRSVSLRPTTALLTRRRTESCSSNIGSGAPLSPATALDDDELTCICSGGPAGAWSAVGTKHGGVALIDRYCLFPIGAHATPPSLAEASSSYAFTFDNDDGEDPLFPLQPFCLLPDVSGGRCAPVCDISISSSTTTAFRPSSGVEDGVTSTTSTRLTPLLATISGKPMGSLLSIWRLPEPSKSVEHGTEVAEESVETVVLHAEFRMENSPIPVDRKVTRTKWFSLKVHNPPILEVRIGHGKRAINVIDRLAVTFYHPGGWVAGGSYVIGPLAFNRMLMAQQHLALWSYQEAPGDLAASARCRRPENGNRFRHCEFLHLLHQIHPPTPSPFDSGLFGFLAATEQPVSPTTRSVCHLSVWLVPLPLLPPPPSSAAVILAKQTPPVMGLERFAIFALPPGEIAACLAVHPSRTRGLIALGTMEGSVSVYAVSLVKQRLVQVYSMPRAHPLFVTSLTFLPPREKPLPRQEGAEALSPLMPLPPHYELVSASADRVIRWHAGPGLRRVARETGTCAKSSAPGVFVVGRLCLFLLLLSLLPLIWGPLNALLNHYRL